MIRTAGIVAAAASAVFLVLVLLTLRSGELTATVLQSDTTVSFGSAAFGVLDVDPPNGGAEDPKLTAAGIRPMMITEVPETTRKTWGYVVPSEFAATARAGDELRIRSRRLALGIGGEWTWNRYELRRGSELREHAGPENRKFGLVVAAIVGGPVGLWGLAALMAALATLRRGPSIRNPG